MHTMQPLPFAVYVLRSRVDGRLYTGFTTNLPSRLADHATGGTTSTACRRPLDLVYCEFHLIESDARRREGYLKTSAGKRAIRQMIRDCLRSQRAESPETW